MKKNFSKKDSVIAKHSTAFFKSEDELAGVQPFIPINQMIV